MVKEARHANAASYMSKPVHNRIYFSHKGGLWYVATISSVASISFTNRQKTWKGTYKL